METKLPKGWVETEFANVISLMTNGGNFKQEDIGYKGYYPISRIETIWNEEVDLDRVKYAKVTDSDFEKYSLKIGDILFSHINSDKHLGKTAIYKTNVQLVHGINLLLLRCEINVLPDYTNYYLRNYRFKGGFLEIAQRSVNQSSINQKKLSTISFLLPPLPEQERIVAKLDKLFAQHEKIKKAIDRIPQLLKAFRQQVLTQAVKSKKGTRKLKEFLTDIKYGTSKKSEYAINGTPVLRIPNIENGRISDKDLKYSILDKKEFNTLRLNKNDILIIRSNGSVSLVGQSAIVTSEHENYSYAGYLIRIRLNEKYRADYLNYIFKSSFIRSQMVDTSRSTSGVNNINSKEIQELNIPDVEIVEQREIVRRVESLFVKADMIEARYHELKRKVDKLPQAILHKTFKGELVPQLLTDGDAKDLLEEVMALKEETKGKRGKG